MEDTLGVMTTIREHLSKGVLILVLMEDTLGATSRALVSRATLSVLILVLMEDTLGGKYLNCGFGSAISLNPCFNGRYSRRISRVFNRIIF